MSPKAVMKLVSVILILLIFVIVVIASVIKIPAGYVGVKINTLGSSKGVQVEQLPVGIHFLWPSQTAEKFPTFTQNVEWSGELKQISFQTTEGMKVRADVGITYNIDPNKASKLYESYRSGINEITNKFVYTIVRDAFNEVSSRLKVESVYGEGKTAMLREVEEKVRSQLDHKGIIVERVYYAKDLYLPDQVTEALNAKIRATQMAEQRVNEVAQSKAEADKLREQAKGESDAILIKAKAEAEAIEIRSKALDNNNGVILLNFIDKWDGALPTTLSLGDAIQLMIQAMNEKQNK